jgi:hypothetical protein
MKTICSFCGTVVRPGTTPDDTVSHGVCPSCLARIRSQYGLDTRKFLDMLDAPVFLVDRDANILAANSLAIEAVKKPVERVQGKLCGTVLDCINACLPEGCGKTEFCPDCTIRAAVNETWTTGQPVNLRPAVFRRRTNGTEGTVSLWVSTRKDRKVVLLRLEPVQTF